VDNRLDQSSRVKCLLVDDLDENLIALSALLARDDVDVLMARSGVEALNLLLVHDVALAIVDVQMPEMDGFELAELMRGSERTRHVPLIFVTAGSRDQHRLFKGYDAGAVDFLYKPIEPQILKNKADVFFQLHRQKRQLVRELEDRTETLRFNEMFAAVLGHDLRVPLNAIVISTHLLKARSEDTTVHEDAARILSSTMRMNRMVSDLLDFTRARLAGGIVIRRTRADLAALIERVVQEQQTAFPEQRIEVTRAGDLNGEWDPDRLSQVASNLIGNALQHGDKKGPVQVCLDGTCKDAVTLSVTNAGRIPPELRPGLFTPFRGGDRGPRRSEGLGLGLYIAQQIVLAHQGNIDLEPGETHTALRVVIPRKRA
jgi:signal transduction histidine kinase